VALLGIYSFLDGPESDHVAVFVSELHDHQAAEALRSAEWSSSQAEVGKVRWSPAEHLPRGATEQTRSILADWRQGQTSTYRVVDEA